MTDPRIGLRRRPQFSELEARARKGKPKITGLSYDPLRVLFDPLHVKMAQELGEQAREHTQRMIAEQRRQHDVREFASQTGLDPAFAEEIPSEMFDLEEPRKDDDADMDPLDGGKDDDDDDQGGGGGSHYPRGGGAVQMLVNPREEDPETSRPTGGTGQMTDYQQRGQGPPPPPPSAGIAYREAVEVKAELEALRQELARQAQRQAVAEEIRKGMQVKNPAKEIIREIHHVPQPYAVPQPVPMPSVNTNQLMEAAKQTGVDIGMLTEKLAVSRAQLAEALRKPEPEVSVASSSNQPPPPPPPPGRAPRSRSPPRAKAAPPTPEPTTAATRALSGGSQPPEKRGRPSMATPIGREPSQSSLAPTVNYGPSRGSSKASRSGSIAASSRQSSLAPTVNYGPSRSGSAAASREPSRAPSEAKSEKPSGPSPEPSAQAVPRSGSIAESRSRSRGRPLLPIAEDTPSRRETMKKVIQQMQEATASNDARVKNTMRMQLSKFARSVAPQARQARQQPPKRAKSFDELEAEAEIMEQAVPFGAAMQRQKTGPAIPDWQKRFQGRLVRAASR